MFYLIASTLPLVTCFEMGRLGCGFVWWIDRVCAVLDLTLIFEDFFNPGEKGIWKDEGSMLVKI